MKIVSHMPRRHFAWDVPVSSIYDSTHAHTQIHSVSQSNVQADNNATTSNRIDHLQIMYVKCWKAGHLSYRIHLRLRLGKSVRSFHLTHRIEATLYHRSFSGAPHFYLTQIRINLTGDWGERYKETWLRTQSHSQLTEQITVTKEGEYKDR